MLLISPDVESALPQSTLSVLASSLPLEEVSDHFHLEVSRSSLTFKSSAKAATHS